MLNRERAMPSITLERSRPVLMTHFAPCRCKSAIRACKSCGTGGSSDSAWSVPSKSVDISLIGNDMLNRYLHLRPKVPCHNVHCQSDYADTTGTIRRSHVRFQHRQLRFRDYPV